MNILFSSCGRRVELISLFKEAVKKECGDDSKLISIDNDRLAAAHNICDKNYWIPKIDNSSFIESVLNICKEECVDTIIPLIDPELVVYAENRDVFEKHHINVIVSDVNIIKICESKLEIQKFYDDVGIPHIVTLEVEKFLSTKPFDYPVIIKPCSGSGSKDVYAVSSEEELSVISRYILDPVVQPRLESPEVTIDCLCGFDGEPINAISRFRIETRAGESCKGRTFRDEKLLGYTHRILKALRARGPITIQCFKVDDDYIFGEINPRFGGGYPLSHAAGANYPRLIIKMLRGESVSGLWGKYEEDVVFTRYDQSFFFKVKEKNGFDRLVAIDGYKVDF